MRFLDFFWVEERAIWLGFANKCECICAITERVDLDIAYGTLDSTSCVFTNYELTNMFILRIFTTYLFSKLCGDPMTMLVVPSSFEFSNSIALSSSHVGSL